MNSITPTIFPNVTYFDHKVFIIVERIEIFCTKQFSTEIYN